MARTWSRLGCGWAACRLRSRPPRRREPLSRRKAAPISTCLDQCCPCGDYPLSQIRRGSHVPSSPVCLLARSGPSAIYFFSAVSVPPSIWAIVTHLGDPTVTGGCRMGVGAECRGALPW